MKKLKIMDLGKNAGGLAVLFTGMQISWVEPGLGKCDQITLVGDLLIGDNIYPIGGTVPVKTDSQHAYDHQIPDWENEDANIQTDAPIDIAELKQNLAMPCKYLTLGKD